MNGYDEQIKINKISKEEFLNIDEDDIMFITNPGRMGDEDGSSFIVKKNNEFIIYRLSEWMYRSKDFNEIKHISLNDALNQFPKWHEAWKNGDDENYHGKYKYLYMGFGNGLSINNSIYNEFKPYLDKKIDILFANYWEQTLEIHNYLKIQRPDLFGIYNLSEEEEFYISKKNSKTKDKIYQIFS